MTQALLEGGFDAAFEIRFPALFSWSLFEDVLDVDLFDGSDTYFRHLTEDQRHHFPSECNIFGQSRTPISLNTEDSDECFDLFQGLVMAMDNHYKEEKNVSRGL